MSEQFLRVYTEEECSGARIIRLDGRSRASLQHICQTFKNITEDSKALHFISLRHLNQFSITVDAI